MALIFQYGSNCSESEINSQERLRGDARLVGIAESVEDYQLTFDVLSRGRGCAAADIVRCAGNKVWGVLYDIPDFLIRRESAKEHGRKSLDAIEGEGKNYKRREIDVKASDGKIHTAITYTVINPQAGLRTSLEYVRHIVQGLRDHKVPDDYISNVKAIASANNPAIAAEVSAL